MKSWTTRNGNKVIRVLSGRSNVFLVTDGQNNILVDTATRNQWNRLEKRLNRLGITHLESLILTHAHVDHAGNAQRIREKFGTSVLVHRNESSCLTSGDNIIPAGTVWVSRLLVNALSGLLAPAMRFTPCLPDILVDAEYDLRDKGPNARIIHTPGHTPGSMSVIVDNEVAIVGDCMFGIFPGSVFPPYACDPDEMVRSWGKLLDTGCTVFLPSHGSANERALVQKEYEKRAGRASMSSTQA